jgi:hypothetical protein
VNDDGLLRLATHLFGQPCDGIILYRDDVDIGFFGYFIDVGGVGTSQLSSQLAGMLCCLAKHLYYLLPSLAQGQSQLRGQISRSYKNYLHNGCKGTKKILTFVVKILFTQQKRLFLHPKI